MQELFSPCGLCSNLTGIRSKMIDALRSAGASEEIVALMQSCFDACIKPGRPRKYPNRAAKQRAYRARRKQREKGHVSLRGRLYEAAQGQIESLADVAPILALIEQGCDLEADVLPVVARTVPELPRPLKNWGAAWLVREILAAREQRLAGHRADDPGRDAR
jgi:hypothetical protein